jgi:hypothetical protein
MFRSDTGTRERPANQHRGRGDDGGLIWGSRDKTQGFEGPFSDKTAAGRGRPADVLTHLASRRLIAGRSQQTSCDCDKPASRIRRTRANSWNVGIRLEHERAQFCAPTPRQRAPAYAGVRWQLTRGNASEEPLLGDITTETTIVRDHYSSSSLGTTGPSAAAPRAPCPGSGLPIARRVSLEDHRQPVWTTWCRTRRAAVREECRLPPAPAPLIEQVGQRIFVVARMVGQPDHHRLIFFHRVPS